MGGGARTGTQLQPPTSQRQGMAHFKGPMGLRQGHMAVTTPLEPDRGEAECEEGRGGRAYRPPATRSILLNQHCKSKVHQCHTDAQTIWWVFKIKKKVGGWF